MTCMVTTRFMLVDNGSNDASDADDLIAAEKKLALLLLTDVTEMIWEQSPTLAEAEDHLLLQSDQLSLGWTMLMQAAYEDSAEVIPGLLMDFTADIEQRNEAGESALIVAAEYGHVYSVTVLLKAGADVNGRSSDGRTALHYAVLGNLDGDINRCKTIEVLLSAGANVNARCEELSTPLFVACSMDEDRILETILLLRNGADPTITDHQFDTALHQICGATPIDIVSCRLLLQNGANPQALDWDGQSSTHIAWFSENGIDAIREMLAFGNLDINFADLDGETLLHKGGDDASMFEFLLGEGINTDTQNIVGDTPLHCLAKDPETVKRSLKCVRLLLDAGVSTKILNNAGQTARQVAEEIKNFDVVDLIDREVCQPDPSCLDVSHRG